MLKPDLSFHREMFLWDLEQIYKNKKNMSNKLIEGFDKLIDNGFEFRSSKKLISSHKMHVDIEIKDSGVLELTLINKYGNEIRFLGCIDE